MAALQLGPLDNPDNIFRDDSYSSFDQSFIDQDSIFEEIDEENDYMEKENKGYDEILETIQQTVDIDLNLLNKMDSETSLQFLSKLYQDQIPIDPDDDKSSKIKQEVKPSVGIKSNFGLYERRKRLRNQKLLENYNYRKLQRAKNFNRKLKVLAIKVIVIAGKIAFKAYLSGNAGMLLLPFITGENSINFLDKSKTDWLMLILETCGIVVPHEISRISNGIGSTAALFLEHMNSEEVLDKLINSEAFIKSRNFQTLMEKGTKSDNTSFTSRIYLDNLIRKYFSDPTRHGFLDFETLNKEGNEDDKAFILKLWQDFIKLQGEDKNVFQHVFENSDNKITEKEEPITQKILGDEKKMTDLIKKYHNGEIKNYLLGGVGSKIKQHVKIILDTIIQPLMMADLINEDTKQAIDNIISSLLTETNKSVQDQFKDILKDQGIVITDGDWEAKFKYKIPSSEKILEA